MAKLVDKITKGIYTLDNENWAKISIEAKDLIKKLMEVNPKERLSAEAALQHPWLY